MVQFDYLIFEVIFFLRNLFEIGSYSDCKSGDIPNSFVSGEECIPQAFGGGRNRESNNRETLLLNFNSQKYKPTLYSVDFSPNGHHFIVGSGLGDVRLFDMRFIRNQSRNCYVNIYRNLNIKNPKNCEVTGCAFNYNGTEIVSTSLCEYIYLFDVNKNYEKEFNLDYHNRNGRIPRPSMCEDLTPMV